MNVDDYDDEAVDLAHAAEHASRDRLHADLLATRARVEALETTLRDVLRGLPVGADNLPHDAIARAVLVLREGHQ